MRAAVAPTFSGATAWREPPVLFAGLLLTAAAVAAYANSFSGPLVLDDLVNIADNTSLRRLSDWRSVWWPPASVPTAGRPVLNASFAFNYAFGGLAVPGYHAVNLAIHVGAALLAFLLLRETFARPRAWPPGPRSVGWLALAAALIWAVHPICTAAVTYISQRAESLMAMWYLATLYCLARGAWSPRGGAWLALSIACCATGMATKEVMVTAPVVAILYDRTFIAGSFREAWRQRRAFYVGLAGTWVLLAALMIASQTRSRGIADAGSYTPWTYALTECTVVPHYLKLAAWPQPLIFDYEIDREALAKLSIGGVIGPAAFLFVVGAVAAVALWRSRAIGFFAAWFFIIIAPTSSVVPITFQPIAESRAYLPLLGIIVATVLALQRPLGGAFFYVAVAAAVAGGVAVRARNQDYTSELRLWADTVAKRPQNARAHNAYGLALNRLPNRFVEEIAEYEAALRLRPDYADAHNNLGNALLRVPARWPEAMAHFRAALTQQPNSARTHSNLGNLLSLMPGRLDEALEEHREAIRLAPDLATVHFNYGLALMRQPGGEDAAVREYERALAIKPDYAEAHNALGLVLAGRSGADAAAIRHFREAVRLRPDADALHVNLAAVLARNPTLQAEAAAHYEVAAGLNPRNSPARLQYAMLLLNQPGRQTEAGEHFAAILRAEPQNAHAHYGLALALLRIPSRQAEAIGHLQQAAQLAPEWAEPRAVLASLTGQRN